MISRYAVVGLPLVLAGCDMAPEYLRPATLADSAISYVNRLTTTDEAETATQPSPALNRWWESIDDPALNGWVTQLLADNLSLKAAAERIHQARERVVIEGGARYPSLSVGGDVSRTRDTTGGTRFGSGGSSTFYNTSMSGSVDISWQLDLFGRVRSAVTSAEYSALASQADYDALMHSLIADLVTQRVNIATLQQTLLVQRSIVASRQQTLETVTRRYELGVETASVVDVYSARENLSSAQAEIPSLTGRLKEALITTDILLGQAPGTLTLQSDPFPVIPDTAPPPPDVPARLLDRRPDIRSAELDLKARNADIGVAVAQLFPDLSIGSSVGITSSRLSDFLDAKDIVASLAGSIQVALFEGGALRANIRLQESELQEASINYAELVLSAMGEVETALIQERYLREQVELLRSSVSNARAAETNAQERYAKGIETLLSVLDTQRRRQNAEIALLSAQQSYWNARIALYLALGGDWLERDKGRGTRDEEDISTSSLASRPSSLSTEHKDNTP